LKFAGTGKTELELRQLLGCFLFSGDDVFKKIKVLSGGEKARVALAKTIAMKGNFLMLDEPTNHLDMQSVEMLIDALNKYEGTMILVSHDRYFISKLANKIWWLEDQKIKEFIGSYDEWGVFMQDREKRSKKAEPVIEKQVVVEAPKVVKQVNTSEQRELQKEHQKQQKAFQKLEEQINKMKEEKAKLEEQLADPAFYSDKDKFQKLDEMYKQHSAKLDVLNKEYDKAFELIMELEEKIG
jgi:ATP-binding cassette subfamily F protein 3